MESKNIFTELVLSCFSIRSYEAIRKNKFFKRFFYHILLAIVIFGVGTYLPYTRAMAEIGGIESVIKEYVPDFTISDGQFSIERPVTFREGGVIVEIDPVKHFEYYDGSIYAYDTPEAMEPSALYGTDVYSSLCFVDSEKVLLYTDDEGFKEMYFSELQELTNGDITRQSVIDGINAIIPVGLVLIFIGIFISIMFNSFVNAIILLIIANSKNCNLPFMQHYTISLYARTPVSIVFAILGAIGMTVPFKWIIGIAVTAAYSSFIIDEINRNMNEPEPEPEIGFEAEI